MLLQGQAAKDPSAVAQLQDLDLVHGQPHVSRGEEKAGAEALLTRQVLHGDVRWTAPRRDIDPQGAERALQPGSDDADRRTLLLRPARQVAVLEIIGEQRSLEDRGQQDEQPAVDVAHHDDAVSEEREGGPGTIEAVAARQ